MIRVSAVKMLEFNQLKDKRRAVDILTKLLSNIQKDPTVGVENEENEGDWETLIGVGYVWDGDRLVLPLGKGSQKIEEYLAALKKEQREESEATAKKI